MIVKEKIGRILPVLSLPTVAFFLTGAAQYMVFPAPLELKSEEVLALNEHVTPGDVVASYKVEGQPVARLDTNYEISLAGQNYNFAKGKVLKPHFVIMSGASKIIKANTRVYCDDPKSLTALERGGVAGLGSRYSMAVQICMVPNQSNTGFIKAFLNGAKASQDRIPTDLPTPAPYSLLPDEVSPDRLEVIYSTVNKDTGQFSLQLSKGQSYGIAGSKQPPQSVYIFFRPKIYDKDWTGYDRNLKAFQSSVRFKYAKVQDKPLSLIEGQFTLRPGQKTNHSVSVKVVYPPRSGLFRAGYVSTAPISVYVP